MMKASLQSLDVLRNALVKSHPGWRIWFVPNALDGTVTWCAQHEPLLHADTPEHLAEYMIEAEADIAWAADRLGPVGTPAGVWAIPGCMDVDLPICATCGVQYPAPREDCPICLDERQYVGWDGQRWTSLAELAAAGHKGYIAGEGSGVLGIGAQPPTAIGQRALLIKTPSGNVLFDMISYLDEDLADHIRRLGGIQAIAISHPHFYGSMTEWAREFDAPVYIHAADQEWVARPDPLVRFWDGETEQIGDGLTLINVGVHFEGGQVLHWAGAEDGAGAVFSGDIMTVVQDRRYVSFMYSYPNLIPERPEVIRRGLARLKPYPFERVYGAWWRRVVETDGSAAVARSAERYLRFALGGDGAQTGGLG